MSVKVKCRHCLRAIGEMKDSNQVQQLVQEQPLSNDELNEILQEDEQGELNVLLVCEECEEILTQNPSLFEQDNFIH
ncbi:anti-sigma-F factor Fin [Alkalibacillus silvisoli]|uniref:Anti-sigma-F factor Fin family protein n=1 Tax=Alkalibacillus silvisoli TaxID=392823 RepID=A0ABP3K1A8_9BACI